mmetsp:Transcript_3635/g.12169  ORF Transcript_3635/g.12169 Transcript_3635/m.12169 type:complete len:379 (+) Transcript_3635:77-1213(+)
MSYKPHLPELVSDLKSNPSLIHDAEFLDLKHVLETAFASTFPPKSNTTANNEEDVEDNVDIKIEDRDIVGPEVEPVDPPLLSVKEGEELSETDMNSMMEAKSNASQAFSNGDFASALEEYTKALRLQPTSALTFSKRAECFVKLKRNKAAKQDCEQALKINPDSAKAMKVLGTAQRYLGEYEEACKNLGQGLAIDFDEESAKVEKEAEKFFHEIRVAKSKEKAKREQEEKKKMEERRKEAEEAMKNANMGGGNGGTPGGNPGGFPGAFPPGMEGLMNDPEVMEAMMNPKVMSVLQQAQSNPGALIAAMSDPEVGPLLQKIVGKMGGSMGGGGGGGGKDCGEDENDDNGGEFQEEEEERERAAKIGKYEIREFAFLGRS